MSAVESDHEDGFTVIELMLVVGIIAVLIAIMIPNLLSARTPAQDRQAQNLLRNSLTAARAIETSDGVTPTQASLALEEPAVGFVASSTSAPANRRAVSVANVASGSNVYVILASRSTSGRCFAVLSHPSIETRFQRLDNLSTCQADQFDPLVGWLQDWP